MGKPLGLTRDLRVRYPAPWEDEIWQAAGDAAQDGVSLKRVLREAEDAWRDMHREMAKEEVREL